MKNLLLTLAAATLMTSAATAQVKSVTLGAGAPKDLSAVTLKSNFANKQLVVNSAEQNRMAKVQMRVDDAKRSHKMLSYLVDGTELQNCEILPLGDKFSDMKAQNVTGYGFAQAYWPQMLERYAGNTITKINFAAWQATYKGVFVYIMDGMTGQLYWQGNVDDVKLSNNDEGILMNEVPCNYTITGQEQCLLIGWMAKDASAHATDPNPAAAGPVLIAHPDKTMAQQGAYFMIYMSNGQWGVAGNASAWQDSQKNPLYFSSLIQVETEGEGGVKDYDVQMGGVGSIRSKLSAGDPKANVSFTNLGLESVASIDYQFEVDGATKEGSFAFKNPIPFFQGANVDLVALLPKAEGRAMGKLTITKVNSVADEVTANDDNVALFPVMAFEKGYQRIPVVEEFTATGCGWCPYGIVGLETEKSKRQNDIVLIAAHAAEFNGVKDPLAINDYQQAIGYFAPGFPHAVVNREYAGHPYAELAGMDLAVVNTPAEASLVVKASKPNSLTKKITAETELEFLVDAAAGEYSVFYVVTEDDVTGVNQLNYFSALLAQYKQAGYTEQQAFKAEGWGPDLQEVAKAGQNDGRGNFWYQPVFNHTAVAVNDVFAMAPASQLPAITAGTTLKHKADIEVPTRPGIAIKNANLQVAALLVDNSTGVIVTGRQVAAGETSEASAIESVENANIADVQVVAGAFNVKAENAKAEVYSVDGKLVSSCTVKGEASLPTFGAGVYVIRVEANGQVMTKKATF